MISTLVIDFDKVCWLAGTVSFDIDEFLESSFNFGSLKGYWSPDCHINQEYNRIVAGACIIPMSEAKLISWHFASAEFELKPIVTLN